MYKIGIISDTHTCFDDKLKKFLDPVDFIWHAGDIGSVETADAIAAFKPLVAVYGNADDCNIRHIHPAIRAFKCEEVGVLMTHIGGYPKRYDPLFLKKILSLEPKIVVCGHSHILKVVYDHSLKHLHINPGAAGTYGPHKLRTAIRLVIDGSDMRDMEVANWPRQLKPQTNQNR